MTRITTDCALSWAFSMRAWLRESATLRKPDAEALGISRRLFDRRSGDWPAHSQQDDEEMVLGHILRLVRFGCWFCSIRDYEFAGPQMMLVNRFIAGASVTIPSRRRGRLGRVYLRHDCRDVSSVS